MGNAIANRIIFRRIKFAAPEKYKSRFPEKGRRLFCEFEKKVQFYVHETNTKTGFSSQRI